MRALVEGIEAVLPDGSVHHGLDALKKDNRGYDIKQLLIGAEGTIGVVTAASLRLVPAITDRAVGWIGVETPEAALALFRFAERVIGDVVEGFEGLADDTLAAVLNLIPGARCPTATRSPWYVLLEVDLEPAEGTPAHERLENALVAAFPNGLTPDPAIADPAPQAEPVRALAQAPYRAAGSGGA